MKYEYILQEVPNQIIHPNPSEQCELIFDLLANRSKEQIAGIIYDALTLMQQDTSLEPYEAFGTAYQNAVTAPVNGTN